MTDDIVTRLRDWANRLYPMKYGACMEEAADEIELLRQHVRTLDKACDQLEEQVAFWIQVSHNKKKRWWHRD